MAAEARSSGMGVLGRLRCGGRALSLLQRLAEGEGLLAVLVVHVPSRRRTRALCAHAARLMRLQAVLLRRVGAPVRGARHLKHGAQTVDFAAVENVVELAMPI